MLEIMSDAYRLDKGSMSGRAPEMSRMSNFHQTFGAILMTPYILNPLRQRRYTSGKINAMKAQTFWYSTTGSSAEWSGNIIRALSTTVDFR